MSREPRVLRFKPGAHKLRPTVCGLVWAFLFAWTFGLSGSLAGEPESAAEVGFRRIFVPADSPEAWPIGTERYLPIPKSEFSRLIQEQHQHHIRKESTAVRLASAAYRAELVGDQLLVGTAELVLHLASEHPRLQSLSPLNLSITSAFWSRDESKQAEIGIWQQAALRQELGVLVGQSDTLHFDWQLRANASSPSSIDFLLAIPVAVPQAFALVLPAGHTATLESGKLLRTEDLADGKTRWWFQLAPTAMHPLRVFRQTQTASKKKLLQNTLPLITQATSYRLEPAGLTFLTSLHLDAMETSTSELFLALPREAKIIEVTLDQQPAAWNIDTDSEGSRLVIGRPPSPTPQLVEIHGLTQMQFDQRWQLPRLRPQEVLWSEGTSSLTVFPALEIRSLVPRQASLEQIEGIRDGQPTREVYHLKEWSEEASLEVVVSRRQSQWKVRTATTLDLDPKDSELDNSQPNKSTAQTVAMLSCQGRSAYQIEAEVSSGWSIESVKSDPSTALREWHVHEGGDRKLMRIQLVSPVGPESSLRLEIDARATKEGSLLPATARQLSPIRFLTGDPTQQLLLLRNRERGQMELLYGLDRTRLAPDTLAPEDIELLPELGEGVLMDLTHTDEEAIVELLPRSDRYHADINIEVRVLPRALVHRYQLDCSPISGVVSEVLVELDQPLPDFAQWKLVGHRGGVVATRLAPNNSEPSSSPQGATYRLQLPVVVDGPFSLQTQYSSPAKETQPCNLLNLPEASDWRGQVVVRGPLDGVEIEDLSWTPLAKQEETNGESFLPVLGCYRLGSERTRHRAHPKALSIVRTASKPVEANLFAWLAEVHSLQAAHGDAIYVVTYHLENSGSTGAEIQLPPQAELQEAWLDQQPIQPRDVLVDQHTCRFHFEGTQRWPTLAVQYVVRGPTLGYSTPLQPPLPECSFPVNLGRWTLWLPEQYLVSSSPDGAAAPTHSWHQRLFGPLSRSARESVFNPFRADSWKELWPLSTGHRKTPNLTETDLVGLGAQNPSVDPPWSNHAFSPLSGVGRRAATLDFLRTPPVIVVTRATAERAEWHAIWLLTLVLGTWLFADRSNKLVMALTILAAACLLVPPAWLAGPQAMFLGLLSAAVLLLVLKQLAWDVPEQEQTTIQTVTRLAALAALLCAVLLSGQANAESKTTEPKKATSRAPDHLHRVLLPVDSAGVAGSEDVYIPESFLRELKEEAGDHSYDGAQCTLISALYRGELPRDPLHPGDGEEAWSIILSAKSFVADSRLALPFRRSEAQWLAEAHRLDGLPVDLNWNPDGNGCAVNLGATGIHRLELIVRPRVVVSSNLAALQLHVPPLPKAKIDLALPTGSSELHVNLAGKISMDNVTNRWQASLSGGPVLRLNWTPARDSKESESIAEVEQMSWLHVEPLVAHLDVDLLVRATANPTQLLTLETSPQLKLLPQDESSLVEEVEINPESPHTLRLKLKSGVGTTVRVPLRFRLQRTASVGRIPYPYVRLHGVKPTRSLYAVSVSPGLSFDEDLVGDMQNIASTEFATAWGTSSGLPLYAYSQGDDFPDGSLRVWPDPQTMAVQQSMRVHCRLQRAHIQYEATVDEVTGARLSHRLWVPARMTLEDVSVRQQPEMKKVPLRWSRVNNSQVVLFLSEPLQGPHVVTLDGYVKTSNEHTLIPPAISLVGAERNDIHVDLSREADVLVSWVDPEKAPKKVPQQSMARRRTAIPVGRYSWRAVDSKDLGTLRIEKNHQRFTSETLTTIAQGPSGWTASLHGNIHVEQGVLSHITLAVPNGFQPPYRIEPAALGIVGEVRETSAGRQITFLLSKPVPAGNTLEVHFAGDLDLPTNQRLKVPNLRLIDSSRSNRHVLLPTRVGEQPVEWNWTGLTNRVLPESLSHFGNAQKNTRAFLVEQDQFFAQERSYQGPMRNAAMRYAMISGMLDEKGNLTAVAELVLQPGRATHCILRLPPEAQLTQLVIGDTRVRREKLDDRSWRIPLGPPYLPRKIKVVYQTKVEMIHQQVRLLPPEILIGEQLLPLPQTRWHIRFVGHLRLGDPLTGTPLLPEQYGRAAHQLPLETLADARLLALELPIREGRAWFQPWQQNIQQAWNEWRARETTAETIDEPSPSLLGSDLPAKELTNVWPILVGKLGDASVAGAARVPDSNYPPKLPDQFSASLVGSASLVDDEAYFISDQQGQLIVSILRRNQARRWRWFFAAALAAGGLALAWHQRAKPDWYDHWLHPLVLAAGLAWWLFLSPSAVGLLLAVLGLCSVGFKTQGIGNRIRQMLRGNSATTAR